MYDQSGEVDGIKWFARYHGGRKFTLHVGHLSREYTCAYEPIFGVDAGDYARMSEIMDEMQASIVGGFVDNTTIEKTLAEIESTKSRRRAEGILKAKLRKPSDEEFAEYLKNKMEDTPEGLGMEFMYGHITYEQVIDKMLALLSKQEG